MERGGVPVEAEHRLRGAGRVFVQIASSDARAEMVSAIEEDGFVVCVERPDVALVHDERPAFAVDVARDLLEVDDDVAVILFDDDLDNALFFSALDAGVAGVLPLHIDPQLLPRILHGVIAGEAAIGRADMGRVLREFRSRSARSADADATRLSPRQEEVLELLARGLSTSEIASELFISRVTVRTHVLAILRQLDVPDRASAIAQYVARR